MTAGRDGGGNEVVRFPVGPGKRWKNRLGRGAVPCEVSGRWLVLPDTAQDVGGRHLMFVDIMTMDGAGTRRKLCQLCLSLEDLQETLKGVQTKSPS
jgi:hypothetical protein